jgi:hypothetical protein
MDPIRTWHGMLTAEECRIWIDASRGVAGVFARQGKGLHEKSHYVFQSALLTDYFTETLLGQQIRERHDSYRNAKTCPIVVLNCLEAPLFLAGDLRTGNARVSGLPQGRMVKGERVGPPMIPGLREGYHGFGVFALRGIGDQGISFGFDLSSPEVPCRISIGGSINDGFHDHSPAVVIRADSDADKARGDAVAIGRNGPRSQNATATWADNSGKTTGRIRMDACAVSLDFQPDYAVFVSIVPA